MTPSSPATEVQKAGGPRELEQRQKNPDRVESLWAQLGPNANGELDLKGLQKGFRKIDHREDSPPLPLFISFVLGVAALRIPPRIFWWSRC
jgi:hypothetical protein